MDKEMYEKAKEYAINKMIEKYCKNSDEQTKIALKEFCEAFLESFMLGERDIFLQNHVQDKGNGFYTRTVNSAGISYSLNIPRTRSGQFRSSILPERWKRNTTEYTQFVMALVLNGYSPTQIMDVLETLKLPYTKEELTKIREQLMERLKDFKTRQLPTSAFALVVDAYRCQVKKDGRVRDASVYIVLGIDMEGKKDIYGFYVHFGPENKFDWMRVFDDLVSRGLKRVMVLVSDNFPGMNDAVKLAYPEADHQLCWVHLKRNVNKHMNKEDAKQFKKELKQIKVQPDYDTGLEQLKKLCESYKEKYPIFMKKLLNDAEKYVVFLKYPDEVRSYIYTTNAAESFNSMLEKERHRKGEYFQSVEVLELNVFLIRERLKEKNWKNSIPKIKGVEYELLQLFNLRYANQTQFF
ncbi:IS256 family transposase [Thermosipho ferrireducens]|uniref:Mutator family transposase n=1 Tax=Thermosipho ferrireducens TaxID=2571116 RepID=A0ABX7S8L4_9BACT|nr:IS256 family transposase [Thermosipho ferrireducens]QTA38944.1 IS256 family transposase [Thermosipho ferrireducens]